MKCPCGSNMELIKTPRPGRLYKKIIMVQNVPLYICPDCEDRYCTGSDSLRFASRVRQAYKDGLESIEF